MNARQLGALSVTLGAMAMAVGGFGFGVRALEGGALSPVKTTPVPEPPVSSSSLATPTTTTVPAPATPTSSPYVPLYPGVADAVELAVSVSFPGLSIPGIEPRCFDTAVATATVADPDVGAAVDELTADATTWWQTDRPIRERFMIAYVGCADFDQLLFFLAIATMNSLDAAPCVAAGWSGVLTPHLLASSLAYGTGLDDLPPATVGPARRCDVAVHVRRAGMDRLVDRGRRARARRRDGDPTICRRVHRHELRARARHRAGGRAPGADAARADVERR